MTGGGLAILGLGLWFGLWQLGNSLVECMRIYYYSVNPDKGSPW